MSHDPIVDILQCPVSKQRLTRVGETLVTLDGEFEYAMVDGIYNLLPDGLDESESGRKKALVKEFYETYGWNRDAEGVFNDTRMFLDVGKVARRYTRICNERLKRHLPPGGKYLLDAGCGAIPHDEYLAFHEGFENRVCVDMSLAALLAARQRLKGKGIFVLGDLTNLPFVDGTLDAAVSCHALYHVPKDQQATAFEELARVLVPNGKAVVIYSWLRAPLSFLIEKFCRGLARLTGTSRNKLPRGDAPPLPFFPQPYAWFRRQKWNFSHDIQSFRIISGTALERSFGDSAIWAGLARTLLFWQELMPRFTGKYGKHPTIILFSRNR